MLSLLDVGAPHSPIGSFQSAGTRSGPLCIATTTRSAPAARICGTYVCTVARMGSKRRPAMFAAGSTSRGTVVSTPRMPTRTPQTSLITNEPNASEPSLLRTLAASTGNFASLTNFSSTFVPKLNSWFPSAIASYPIAFIAAAIGCVGPSSVAYNVPSGVPWMVSPLSMRSVQGFDLRTSRASVATLARPTEGSSTPL